MFNRILVPTDFSPTAKKALDYAVCLARKSGAELILLHACELMHSSFQDQKELVEEYNGSIQKAACDQLEALKASIDVAGKVSISTQLFDGGVIDAIIQGANTSKAGLIVMGTLGRTGLRNKILGSRTAEVLAESDVPVITVPYFYEWAEPKRILLTLNDPDENTGMLQPVFDIAELFQSDVRAAVFSAEGEDGVEVLAHTWDISAIQYKLQKTFDKTPVKTVHLGGDNFHDAVQEYIDTHGLSLLAMITHRRSNKMEELFHRSITRKMNYYTKVPLLSIHAST